MAIHPTLHLRREGDAYILGPIGWIAKMPDQTFADPKIALNTALTLRKMSGCSLCFSLRPWRQAA